MTRAICLKDELNMLIHDCDKKKDAEACEIVFNKFKWLLRCLNSGYHSFHYERRKATTEPVRPEQEKASIYQEIWGES